MLVLVSGIGVLFYGIVSFSFVVFEKDATAAAECAERGYPELFGDASKDEVLEAVNVRRAKALITALDLDAANVFIALSARQMTPDLFIVPAPTRTRAPPN